MGKYDVKYHNDMNLVSIGALNSSQIDILFSIGLTMSTNYSDKATITFNEIKELSNYSNKNIESFYKDLEGLFKKLLDLDFRIETETNIKRMNLFQYYDIQKDNGVVEIKANEIFLKLFDNMLRGNFTLFDLKDLVSLKSGYSKLMFKLLKGWSGKKKIDYTLEEIYHLLGVPKSTQSMGNFTNKVMKPIKEELPKYFNKLEIEPIKTGRKITGYSFTWKPKASDVALIEDNIIHISEKLYETIEKAKRNRFIKPFLTKENIVKLIDKFTNEEQLIKGLNHAYTEVKQEIKYLSYLIKAIESGIEKQEIKILINDPAPKPIIEVAEVIETVGERKEDQVEEKSEVYKEFLKKSKEAQQQVEEIVYKEYVKECGQDTKIQRLAFKASKRKLIIDYLEARHELRREVIKQQEEETPKEIEVVEVKKKREMTQNQYECVFQIYLSNIKITMNRENREVDVEEERKKFDLANKDTITIIEKEITREELLKRFDELNFSYPLEELEEALKLIDKIYTNRELLDTINSTDRELLDSIVEGLRKYKAG